MNKHKKYSYLDIEKKTKNLFFKSCASKNNFMYIKEFIKIDFFIQPNFITIK